MICSAIVWSLLIHRDFICIEDTNMTTDKDATSKGLLSKKPADRVDDKRELWSTKLEAVLVAIGMCVGVGNIWRFPYVCYANGGGE